MKNKNATKRSAVDLATYRYYIRLNAADNARFLKLMEQVGMTNKSQFIVKVLNANFSENKARILLFKLEKETVQLVTLAQQVISLTKDFETKYLHNDSEN